MRKHRLIKNLIGLILILFLALPIVAYIYTFGFHITTDHAKWSAMGSAMSGIYSPLIAFLTLIVLARQVELQKSSNEHAKNEAFLSKTRADISRILGSIDSELRQQHTSGIPRKSALIQTFAWIDQKDLSADPAKIIAKLWMAECSRLVNEWLAYNNILHGLKAPQDKLYDQAVISTKHRAITELNYETCAALDNLCIALLREGIYFKPEFTSNQVLKSV